MRDETDRRLYIIAGSNGAGKTTFAREFLPEYAHCRRFINPDLIAAGLSPFDPAAAGRQAGRLVLHEIRRSIAAGETFAFESTLSGLTYSRIFRTARAAGYELHLFYLWIPGPELGLARIRDRVEDGGHDVPAVDARRRFPRSLRNLFSLYAAAVDTLHFFDNSRAAPHLVFRSEGGEVTILDRPLYERINMQVNR